MLSLYIVAVYEKVLSTSVLVDTILDIDKKSNKVATVDEILLNLSCYIPIAFDETVTFWLQRVGSLPCARVFAALYACAIA